MGQQQLLLGKICKYHANLQNTALSERDYTCTKTKHPRAVSSILRPRAVMGTLTGAGGQGSHWGRAGQGRQDGGHRGHRKLALCPELLGNIVHLFICSETAKRDIHRCSKKILRVLVFSKSFNFFSSPF